MIKKCGSYNSLQKQGIRNLFKKQPPKVFYKRGVLKNYAKLKEKNVSPSLFFNEVAGLRFIILKRKSYHF